MSDLTERITAVLRLHGDTCTRANADYLAERVAELFTEEKFTDEGIGAKRPMTQWRRWVSSWSVVEQQP